MPAHTIQRVVFTTDLCPGILVLAEMQDASLRIQRDGMMDERRWMLLELEDAVRTYRRMRRRAMGKPAVQTT